MDAPIALFTYNRHWHTQQVLDALAECDGGPETILYVFSDGPKPGSSNTDLEKVREVRELLRNENRFQKFYLTERNENLGLGRSIIDGVSRVIEEHGRVIVLEDDLVVHQHFLKYMNYYLDTYKEKKQVFHICGFQRESWLQFLLSPAYCTRFMNCSGWATWADRWEQRVFEVANIDSYLQQPGKNHSFNYGILEMSAQLELNRNGLATWAIFWYATIQMKNGLCINPRYSFIKNIGDDGSGTNMGRTEKNSIRNPATMFRAFSPKMKETRLAKRHVQEAYGKKSKLRLNSIKNLIFILLTNIRNKMIYQGEE